MSLENPTLLPSIAFHNPSKCKPNFSSPARHHAASMADAPGELPAEGEPEQGQEPQSFEAPVGPLHPPKNRALSIRSNKNSGSATSPRHHTFSFASLRGTAQPELSKKLYKLIKSENHLIQSYENAGKERLSIASQLSDWGEGTNDDAISDVSDKIGVLLSELGEQEDAYAHNIDDSRAILKAIRNTEKSVQPSRDHKAKLTDEIAKLKVKEPESAKLTILEQELVRAEAENLVAEAQLTNVTRQKLKEAYAAEFAATIERAEKQIILARHGRRLLNLLDDTPVIPGDVRPAYEHSNQARQILNDAEDDLKDWQPELEDVPSQSGNVEGSLMHSSVSQHGTTVAGSAAGDESVVHHQPSDVVGVEASRVSSGTDNSVATGHAGRAYQISEAENSQVA
ncbi:sphingolipid long chain base-responsive protein LSP1 [Drepanopeziza brunnea f. sp. 'multigermtubi' MB_m1]|uniref:Sphingolipid long chain base-responsive protein LSP1 n=1 Tax=Marssonina brunnea f. sp. multigermtubi (strain MB_m1) TaxID=1072389 RepID=K1XIQ7_MARBU|nr:sphingolipid long chain base-responsive protein LSP1 [Drepanopeziza brunnea f. sp. 'multigermtubi' MB_m1]EKD20588.1 sphingolipid long chain base-responsive protein LSP1 [Drepanopeziza brunnea f. sp. 'multigermtubi' MB_m1]